MNKEQLQFFYDEIMGLLVWCDDDGASGVDPLLWAKSEIGRTQEMVNMQREKLAQLRAELDKKDAALEEALDTIGKVANYNDNEYTVESLVDMCWDFLSAHPTEAAAEYAAMKEQLDKAVAWHEGDDSPHARLEQTIAALRAENKNHRDMNLLMNDTNNRLRSEIKQTRAENEKLRNTLCLDNNDRPSRLWKLFDENGRLEAAVEEARGLMDELFTWETVYEWEKVREHYRAWLTAHPQEEK